MNILELLEKHQWADDCIECPECGALKFTGENEDINKHFEYCEWKAAIDGLKSGRLVVLPRITLSEIAVDLDMDAEQLLEWIKERGE